MRSSQSAGSGVGTNGVGVILAVVKEEIGLANGL